MCRVRDCSEEYFHLVIKIWKLKSENTLYSNCGIVCCNLHFSSNVPNQLIGKTIKYASCYYIVSIFLLLEFGILHWILKIPFLT